MIRKLLVALALVGASLGLAACNQGGGYPPLGGPPAHPTYTQMTRYCWRAFVASGTEGNGNPQVYAACMATASHLAPYGWKAKR